jgi:hypothetical protein
MTEYPEAMQTPEELRDIARMLLVRSRKLRKMAGVLTRHAEVVLKLANAKHGSNPNGEGRLGEL